MKVLEKMSLFTVNLTFYPYKDYCENFWLASCSIPCGKVHQIDHGSSIPLESIKDSDLVSFRYTIKDPRRKLGFIEIRDLGQYSYGLSLPQDFLQATSYVQGMMFFRPANKELQSAIASLLQKGMCPRENCEVYKCPFMHEKKNRRLDCEKGIHCSDSSLCRMESPLKLHPSRCEVEEEKTSCDRFGCLKEHKNERKQECPFGYYCVIPGCFETLLHPATKKVRSCPKKAKCEEPACELLHPLLCHQNAYRSKCYKFGCRLSHRMPRPIDCETGTLCSDKICTLNHPKDCKLERLGECSVYTCEFRHWKKRKLDCKNGQLCLATVCTLNHPLNCKNEIEGECQKNNCQHRHWKERTPDCEFGFRCNLEACPLLHPPDCSDEITSGNCPFKFCGKRHWTSVPFCLRYWSCKDIAACPALHEPVDRRLQLRLEVVDDETDGMIINPNPYSSSIKDIERVLFYWHDCRIEAKYGNCKRYDCMYIHKKDKLPDCPSGKDCLGVECPLRHPYFCKTCSRFDCKCVPLPGSNYGDDGHYDSRDDDYDDDYDDDW